jgi:hypothetical protein
MKIKSLIAVLGVLVAFACKKEPPPPDISTVVMPPLTHQGINSFGCYVNGELFVANEGPSVWSSEPLSGSFDESTGHFSLQAKRYRPNSSIIEDVRIRATILAGEGKYNFLYFPDGVGLGYGHNMADPKCEYYYKEYPGFDGGKLTITHLDETKNIISGTFYINLINEDCEGDTLLKITDGRFDYSY